MTRTSNKRTINTTVRKMQDHVSSSSSSKQDAAIRAHRALEESKTIRRFAKLLGFLCVLLVIIVFGIDLALLEEMANLVVHNVVAAVALIFGFNFAALAYDSMATPLPGTPQTVSETTPLQGLVRRPSQKCVVPLHRRSKRPVSIVEPPTPKRNSGNVFSGLWPKWKKGSSKSKNEEQPQTEQPPRKQSKKQSSSRRRGWTSGRLSATRSI